ncbi:helix-turn-helix domain-containing protein [Streptosporangium sp. NBC_01639]|uniref:PucR family transcriptional regulator n=1 Tax=Streptosporangium sp. NBC_01639 TaxID=2975948 RepID=UPI0038637ED0|nr:helix-turn-helix domain-containing protein [Streptosporangium sp. NBC_01639]
MLNRLLGAPGLDGLRHLAGPLEARRVVCVRLAESLRDLARQPSGSMIVLTAAATRQAAGYRLDVAIRDAAAASAAALVLTSFDGPLPVTATALAERGALALLTYTGDLAGLAVAAERALSGPAADALVRAEEATSSILRAGGDPDLIAAAASRSLGVPVRTDGAVFSAGTADDTWDGSEAPDILRSGSDSPDVFQSGSDSPAVFHGRPGTPDVFHSGSGTPENPRGRPGPTEDSSGGPGTSEAGSVPPGGHLARAVRLVLGVAALAASSGHSDDHPVRSRAQLLTELLIAPEDQAFRLATRARALGLAIDAWHIALRVEPTALTGSDRYAVLDDTGSVAGRLLRSAGGPDWQLTRADDALIIVRTQQLDPGGDGLRAAVADAGRLLAHLRERFPDAGLRCGVSSAHRGPLGLRASALEARTALLRNPAAASPVTAHDVAGLDRMLVEWYSSDAARQAVQELLAPLLALGSKRAEPLVRTLQSYLDHQGSPARVAEELHLHRNAVSQRIRRIEGLLHTDLGDPQQRLALQLACRAVRI